MKKMIGLSLMIMPIQYMAGQITVLHGHEVGSAAWWLAVIITGTTYLIGFGFSKT